MSCSNKFHKVPVGAWLDQPAFIIGGGPSVGKIGQADLRAIAGSRVIAINNAYKLFPNADYLFWSDKQWYQWNGEKLGGFGGGVLLTTTHVPDHFGGPRLADVQRIKPTSAILSMEPDRLAGLSSGSRALNLAVLLGASPIYCVGFEMTPGSWHNEHLLQADAERYFQFRNDFELMADASSKKGHDVVIIDPTTIKGVRTCSLSQAVASVMNPTIGFWQKSGTSI